MAGELRVPFLGDRPVIIRGPTSFLIISRALEKFPLLVETDTEELVQGVYPGDLIIVSAPEGGEVLPALYLLEMVRTYHLPVIALPKSHPAGKRLSYIVSAAEKIEMRCDIQRGTHPEQHLLCSADEFTGMTFYSDGDDLLIEDPRPGMSISYIQWDPIFTEKNL
ncbi:MAG TPA: alpha/beta hydrolase [Methanocorpusculum sp.]|nr:alpha/beta hydrolase [Methanocorpusculum sp.]HJJ50572.1 alpha/beta hydrolase [Methanocorpusculum sp.]HKL97504.1 alpha/beta hydrolase [Methanocorpusculum sp.]